MKLYVQIFNKYIYIYMFELFFQINFENIIIRHAKFDELINNSYYTIREYKLAINILISHFKIFIVPVIIQLDYGKT